MDNNIKYMIKKNCLNCKKDFYTQESRILDGKGKYCSKQCYFEQKKNPLNCVCKTCGNHFTVISKRFFRKYCSDACRPKKLQDTTEKKCLYCSKKFITKTYRLKIGRGKYCSHKCYSLDLKVTDEQRNQTSLKNISKSRFGGNKEIALKRDNYCCNKCGTKDDLIIHHIDGTGYKSVGSYKLVNNNLNNLLTLCRSCHTKLHNSKRRYSPNLGEIPR